MAMGAEPSVPMAQSTRHTTTSPARASTPAFAERIFSLMVLPAIPCVPVGQTIALCGLSLPAQWDRPSPCVVCHFLPGGTDHRLVWSVTSGPVGPTIALCGLLLPARWDRPSPCVVCHFLLTTAA